ncbi:zinc-binding dehydrogenase [Micromonospora endophytica]|uniref:zinc-binding dehydrogenase n=1 Tax=Micromonospora endophytica TaxID=515350 RepID=UPI001C32428F|nr:zinc-binding dehydrogenase [Micromonospora endophytica]BCJ62110.1 hypothetical protein Jiend_55320 [Micromonospora endophytica]
MRVVQVVGFGGPEMLVAGEAPDQVVGPGQVVIEVAVAGVTFVETQIRRGLDRWHDRPQVPYVPGGLVAGVVSAVGAAGGVGSLLVQLAWTAGARVVGAARGGRKLDAVKELGADAVVDYSTLDWTDQVREATAGAGPDVVFDGVGGEIGRAAFEVTARGGRFSVHGAASGESPTSIPNRPATGVWR